MCTCGDAYWPVKPVIKTSIEAQSRTQLVYSAINVAQGPTALSVTHDRGSSQNELTHFNVRPYNYYYYIAYHYHSHENMHLFFALIVYIACIPGFKV